MNKKRVVGVLIIFLLFAVFAYAKPKQQIQQPLSADDIVARMKIQLE